MTRSTIEDTFEYRLAKVIRSAYEAEDLDALESGAELEYFLNKHDRDLVTQLLYDIDMYMGFDELLKQVQDG